MDFPENKAEYRIAVLGAGTMGNGIAHVFAQFGFPVRLMDISADRLEGARATISRNLDRQIRKGIVAAEEKEEILGRIALTTSLEEAVRDARLVVEAVPESVSLKEEVFRKVDAYAPGEAILATNTSSISITRLASVTKRPEKVVGMHFMNPVPVMRLVEIIRGYATSDETAQTVYKLALALGKTPVEVRDYPGFVSNRILMPMINEAIYTLWQGVAGVEEIDTVMRLGMNHPMGPLALADFIGLDVCLAILEVLYEGFRQERYAPCPLLVNMVRAGKLGVKTGEGFYVYDDRGKPVGVSPVFAKQ